MWVMGQHHMCVLPEIVKGSTARRVSRSGLVSAGYLLRACRASLPLPRKCFRAGRRALCHLRDVLLYVFQKLLKDGKDEFVGCRRSAASPPLVVLRWVKAAKAWLVCERAGGGLDNCTTAPDSRNAAGSLRDCIPQFQHPVPVLLLAGMQASPLV